MYVIVIVLYLSILTTFSFTMPGAAPCVQIQQLTYQQPLNKLGNIHSQIVFFWFWKKKVHTSQYRILHIRAASTVLRGKTHVDARVCTGLCIPWSFVSGYAHRPVDPARRYRRPRNCRGSPPEPPTRPCREQRRVHERENPHRSISARRFDYKLINEYA